MNKTFYYTSIRFFIIIFILQNVFYYVFPSGSYDIMIICNIFGVLFAILSLIPIVGFFSIIVYNLSMVNYIDSVYGVSNANTLNVVVVFIFWSLIMFFYSIIIFYNFAHKKTFNGMDGEGE